MAKYKVGDKVRIVDERTENMNPQGDMDKYLGTVMTIEKYETGYYRMEEDSCWSWWSWYDNMIVGLVNEKVEVHPDFKEWYEGFGEYWTNSQKSFAIYLINQMGFGKGLENSYGEDISEVYPSLRYDMQGSKEKYTRAILDDNWVVKKEQLYYVKLIDCQFGYLNQNEYGGLGTGPSVGGFDLKAKFTEKEIKAIDERYWEFRELVEGNYKMIKFVGENGLGYTEEQLVAIRFDELENGADKLSKFETIEDAINKGKAVGVWSENDGDGNTLTLEAHYAGFLIGLEGDNHLKPEFQKEDQAYVATWLSFDMLEGIKGAMEKYAYLVEGNGSFGEEVK